MRKQRHIDVGTLTQSGNKMSIRHSMSSYNSTDKENSVVRTSLSGLCRLVGGVSYSNLGQGSHTLCIIMILC